MISDPLFILILLPTVFFLIGYALGEWRAKKGPTRNEKGQFVSQKQADDPPRGNVPRETSRPDTVQQAELACEKDEYGRRPLTKYEAKLTQAYVDREAEFARLTSEARSAEAQSEPNYGNGNIKAATGLIDYRTGRAITQAEHEAIFHENFSKAMPKKDWVAIQRERRQQLQAEEE